MKFRKRPIIIEAEQFFMDKLPWPDGVVEQPSYWEKTGEGKWRRFRIRTLEGWIKISDGDWVITGIKGEKYPCKPDIFEKTYVRVK